jgi:thiamine biosynthesis lipoprotein
MSGFVRRARPLLGTIVEIAARGGSVESAFGVVAALQRRLSFHDPASEVGILNERAHRDAVPVGVDTWRVLRAALRLSEESEGAFDVALGGTWRDVRLLRGRRVRFARRMRIDLGGIAKGYCVDRAIAELRRGGAVAALVNAGGDLRAFGPSSFPVELRHPAEPSCTLPWQPLRNAALATSASYPDGAPARWAGGSRLRHGVSVTVRAPRAMLADALTKVVSSPAAERILARYGARAWVLCATAA